MANAMSGEETARTVADVPLNDYEDKLTHAFSRAWERLGELRGIALYWEYDADNDWDSWFFLYDRYSPEAEGDDEWAVSWEADMQGPD